jgi:hypothetical protein
MLDTLAKIYDEGGPLFSVEYSLFEGDARFVTAVGLGFGSVSVVFRAVQDDDTLAVSLGSLVLAPHETLVEASSSIPWSACMGVGILWAWRLTNQQSYPDGVRLEFADPGKASIAVVELIVVASAIQIFVATPLAGEARS